MFRIKHVHDYGFISSGLGAYDKAVVRDKETGEIIGEIHE